MKVHLLNTSSFCCEIVYPSSQENISTISALSDWAQVFIAIANLILAFYLLIYQRERDTKNENSTALLNEQNIKLQWFKELIVQPNMTEIILFYSNLHTIDSKINSNDLTDEEKQNINEFVKLELSKLRKSFVDGLFLIDKEFAQQLMSNLDELIDGITNVIFNDELKLKNPTVYEKNIGSKISVSKNKVIAQLFNYKGI